MISDDPKRVGELLSFEQAEVNGEWTHIDELGITERRLEILKILSQIKKGEINHPTDLVDEWKPAPERTSIDQTESTYEYIDLSNVVGACPDVDRLEQCRIRSILSSIYFRGFDTHGKEFENRPKYIPIDGELYVLDDGIHRTLVCKALGIEEIYAFIQKTG